MVILGRQLKNELEPNGRGRRARMTRLSCLLRDYTTQQPRTGDPQRPELPQRFTHHCRRTMQIGSVWLRETRNIAKEGRRDREADRHSQPS
jgi:uncharacterized protein YcbK (DUF882 family)